LQTFAQNCLHPEHLQPLLQIDSQADFTQINLELYRQFDYLQPCGIDNPEPVFWTPNVRVVEQRLIGKQQAHLKLTLAQPGNPTDIKAIAWRWRDYYPLPARVDIAYRLRANHWNGQTTVELELAGVRLPSS
jgi:single-stranded-DNA-specific exonuclease